MSMFSNIFNAVKSVVSNIRRVPLTTLLTDLISYIPGIIREVKELIETTNNGLTNDEIKKMVEDGLAEFDIMTGEDGIRVIKGSMPVDKREEVLDAIAIIIRNIAFNELKVEGYFEEEEVL